MLSSREFIIFLSIFGRGDQSEGNVLIGEENVSEMSEGGKLAFEFEKKARRDARDIYRRPLSKWRHRVIREFKNSFSPFRRFKIHASWIF